MKFWVSIFAVIWLFAAIAGVFYLARYESAPAAESASHPLIFPPESRIERSPTRATLVFFSHPKCPCTRASLNELARLMNDVDGKLLAYVVFIKPSDAPADWTETDLRAKAEAIPNVRVLIDEGERETRIFNAQTSGLSLLYDRAGNLRFEGGITGARGHEGDNAGKSAVFEIIAKDAAANAETAVFGCPLRKKECLEESVEGGR